MEKTTEETLDQLIFRLKQDGNLQNLKKLHLSASLQACLQIARLALDVPVKTIQLDKAKVWSKIKPVLGQESNFSRSPSSVLSFSAFRFAFPKSLFAIVFVFAVVGLLDSTAVAAQKSLPGQTLYPVKRTVEKIQLTLTINQVKKTEVKIQHAENRLVEAKTIADTKGAKDEKAIEQALNEMQTTTAQAADESTDNKNLLQKMVQLADKQESVLNDIENKVGEDAKKVVNQTLGTVAETKTTATKNLADLESKTEGQITNATSTLEILNTASSTGSVKVEGKTEIKTKPTSTGGILQKLGSPDSSSTVIITPPDLSNYSTETTTLEILELK